jgi:hypothetical protein
MSKMAELEYEQRMAADQLRPSLREAAQAVIDRWDSPKWAHDSVHTGELIAALRDALADDRLDEMQSLTESEYREPHYELWGRVTGGHGGRWAFEQFDSRVWPDGTALYVKVIAKAEGLK